MKNLDKDAAPVVAPSQRKLKLFISRRPGLQSLDIFQQLSALWYINHLVRLTGSHLVRLTSRGRAFAAQAKLSIRSWPWGIRNHILLEKMYSIQKQVVLETILSIWEAVWGKLVQSYKKLHATRFRDLSASSFRALKIDARKLLIIQFNYKKSIKSYLSQEPAF